MNIALWIVHALLAAVFGLAGAAKLAKPHEQLAANDNMAWVEDFTPTTVKAIGALEVAAAIALVVPPVIDVAPALSPLAAAGLVLVMIGATITHGRRRETPNVGLNVILLGMATFVAWGRFGPHSF